MDGTSDATGKNQPLTGAGALARYALIGAVLLAVVAAFAYTGGWLSPRFAAKTSYVLLYALMFIMPLLGWGMLSAAPYPIVIYGSLQLPPILPHDPALYAWLRRLHTDFVLFLFAVFLTHLGAALMHGLIRRDGVLESMASWRPGQRRRG